MQKNEYPPQEPLPAFAAAYDQRAWQLAESVGYEEMAYGADPYQRIALVRPEQSNGTILAFFHGGGWTCGFKEWNLLNAPAIAASGICFASVGYRLAPGVTYPTPVQDCAAGVAQLWLQEAQRQKFPPRLILAGHSAGGHLASLLALQPHWLQAHGLPAGVVQGCAPLSGVYQFGEGSGLSQRPRFLGPAEETSVEHDASPLNHVKAAAPPFYLAWGTRDFPHLVQQGERMAASLRAAGVPVRTLVSEGFDHFDVHLDAGRPDGAWMQGLVDWLQTLETPVASSDLQATD